MNKIIKIFSPPFDQMINHMYNGVFEIAISPNHQILKVGFEDLSICIWAIVSTPELEFREDQSKPDTVTYERVKFCVVKTKDYFPFEIEAPVSRLYIGTVHTTYTEYHVFKIIM